LVAQLADGKKRIKETLSLEQRATINSLIRCKASAAHEKICLKITRKNIMSTQTAIPMIKKPLATALTILLTLALLLSLIAQARAQQNGNGSDENGSTAPTQGQGPTDPAELEAFLDELMPKDMEARHIPGAAVAVVKDGKLFFAKGYGYADLANKIPVDPEQTVFKTGSVGKLFTWTAVMQLVEQGKLDLDADVNTYLDFRIPATYPQPINLKHLLTHTAGFEELYFETFSWDADGLMPVGEWLATHIPARVRPPGEVAAYSNYGAMLAGYIVARASGQPYEQYLQEHIFDPLGMSHSFAQWPLPPDRHASVSLGYWDIGAGLQPVPDYPQYMGQLAMLPAGGHSSSATDMAHFMIAHLQGGRYSDAAIAEGRILKASTVQQMHSTLYTPDPRILGNAYGFFDFSDNGQRTLGHSGGTIGFTTLLLLLPDQKLGLFVAYNNEAVGGLTTQHVGFQRAFFDHYYSASAVAPIQAAPDLAARASRFAGSYRVTESAYKGFEKIGNLISQPVEIRDLGNGKLLFNDHGFEVRLVAVEPLYFRQPEGPLGVVFREDDRGRITHMFADAAPQYAYEKLRWYEMPRFNMALILGCVLIFLSMLPVVATRALWNRRRGAERKPASGGARIAYWLLLGLSVLNLLVVVGLAQMWFFSLGFPRFGLSLIDRIVLGLGVVSAVLTIGALVYAVLAWMKGYWGVAFRAYYTLVAVTAVAFVWFLNFWNQLGWRF
jgi:CubicO group peptidase (beta-lactamase class C family)